MNAITGLGKYLFAIPIAVFGVLHLMNADSMSQMTPGGTIVVYITGICLILFALSVFIGKWDKFAAILLAVFLILIIALVHVPGMSNVDAAQKQMAMSSLLKDLALAGGALMYAHSVAKDTSLVS